MLKKPLRSWLLCAGLIKAELRAFIPTGIDGLFIDQPDIAVRLREQH
ncbi:hypothetical protein [Ectopseudomonas mendocina]|nr:MULTISPECIES: hypothetical protein [Pseudomonas]